MPNPETHSCCTCGYTWKHGHDGSHSCSEHLRAALINLAQYLITVRRVNTPEWMEGLAEEVNRACVTLGDEDRFRFDGDFLRRIKS